MAAGNLSGVRALLKELMDASPDPHLAGERERIFQEFRRRVLGGTGVDADPAKLDPGGLNEAIIREVFDGLIDEIT
jgi:hypothetical protein